MSKIERIIGQSTGEETRELAEAALGALPDHEAVQAILAWARADDSRLDELRAWLEDEGGEAA